MIFAQGRTGSSLLRTILNAHSEVRCEGEILAEPVDEPVGFVEEQAQSSNKPVFGFKVKIYQLTDVQGADPARFLLALHDRSYQIIYLYRENLLRHAFSNTFARRRGRYHDTSQDERPTIRVDPELLIEVMRRRQAHLESEAAALGDLSHMRLSYERDLLEPTSQQRTARRLYRHLGVAPIEVSPDLVRSVSGPLSERIENYPELVEALTGTPYESFLD